MTDNGLPEAQFKTNSDEYRALFERSREGIFRIDAQGTLVFANRRTADIFGCSVDELVGKHFFKLHFGDDLPQAKRNFEARRLGEAGLSEYKVRKKDGTPIWIAVSSAPVLDASGTFIGLTGFVSDIDERKRREDVATQERRLLRLIASNIPLAAVMEDLCATLEAVSRRPLRCTVMLADAAGSRLECIAAPSLPEAFRNSQAITQLEGSDTACAQAVRSGQPAIVPDTSLASVSPVVAEMRQVFGFGAVWSYPIIQDNQTLGTLVLLPLAAGVPDTEDEQVIEFALQVTRLAITHDRGAKALRASEQRFRDFTELAVDWYWEQDAGFRFTEVRYGSDSRPALPPYYDTGSIGKCRWELPYINVSEAFWEEHRRQLAAGQPITGLILQRQDSDGDIRTVEISGQPLFDAVGGLRGYRGVGRDITERVRAEAQVRELNATLEERVLARTAELAAANQELDAHTYSVSHDLRAPLRSVEGFSRALLEDYADALDDSGRDYLQRIGAATERMGVLIDAMYHLSRLTRSLLRIGKLDMSAKVLSVMEALRQTEPARQIDVVVEPGIAAEGDHALLEIVLTNLLDNAWKYTARTEHARIEFGVMRDKENNPVYFVRDNGAGFDMQFSDKLFTLFQRLHRDDEYIGNGIGLATVQRIVQRHGGRIWAEGRKGEGAVFCFTLWGDAALRRTVEADFQQLTA